ncbi:MAG: AMIN domain-containing protein [Candidatus Rokubacteria bacterium]|nr:AMIN domain-containing protein [Candidatus Rokubacteria bacterium]
MKRFGWVWGFLLGLGLVGGLAAPGSGESPTGESLVQLREVSVEPRDAGLVVQIKTSGPAAYETALIDRPTRLVIDLESTGYGWRKTPLNVGMDPLRTIRGSQLKKGVSRVVLELSRQVGYRIDEGPEGLTVMLEPAATAGTPAPAEAKSAAVAEAEAPKAPGPSPAAKAERPRAPEPSVAKAEPPAAEGAKESEPSKAEPARPAAPAPKAKTARPPVVAMAPPPPATAAAPAPIRVAQAPQAQPPASNGSRPISLDFKDADIVNLLRILAAESGRNIVAGEDVKGKVSISLQNVSWELALDTILEARGLQKTERDGVIRIVSTEQLTKEREALAKAQEAKRKGEAEARAKEAEAELKEADAKQRKLAAEAAIAEAQARGPLREETIRLKYADPDEVVTTLEGILGLPKGGAVPATGTALKQTGVTPAIGLGGPPPIAEPPFQQLYGAQPGAPPPGPVSVSAEVLAKGITIRAHKPTNTIFIRHYQADLARIKKLINETLDVPVPQVKIEARMEILDRPTLLDIGVQWGGAGAKRANRNMLVAQGASPRTGAIGIAPVTAPMGFSNPALTLTELLPVAPTTGLPTGGNLVNIPFAFPGSALSPGGPTGSINFGIIGTRFNLNLALQALEVLQKTKTLARPEIVTVENKPAQMSIGEEIPYSTVSSAGTQVQFKEAVLKLEVTPTVIREPDGNKIKMRVIVENNSRGTVTGGIPAIDKRRAETEVVVKEGETLVIGGVKQRQSRETVSKVPLLGNIPLLGWLFKSRSEEVNPERELVIFITPSVLKGGGPVQSTKPATEKPKGS